MNQIELHIYNHYCKLQNIDSVISKEIDDMLTFPIAQADKKRAGMINKIESEIREFGESAKRLRDLDYWQLWDGTAHKFKVWERTFPIGFLKRVKLYIDIMSNHIFQIIDHREVPKLLSPPLRFKGDLREYQKIILDRNLNEERGIFNLATGAGKTIVAIAFLVQKNTKTCIIVPTTKLLNQWIEQLKKLTTATIGFSTSKQTKDGDIFVITQSSLNNALKGRATNDKTIQRHELIRRIYRSCFDLIIDEAHHSASKTWKSVIEEAWNVYYIVGLTATINARSDENDFEYEGLIGDPLAIMDYQSLLEINYAVPIRITWYNVPFVYYKKGTDIRDIQIDYFVRHAERRKITLDTTIDRAFRKDMKTLVLFDRTEHGEHIHNKLKFESWTTRPDIHILFKNEEEFQSRIGFVDGSIKTKDREPIYDAFEHGKMNVLFAHYRLIGEGWDMPNLKCINFIMGGKALITLIQFLGRGGRTAHNKTELEVIEYADQGLYLQDHAAERARVYHEHGCLQPNINSTSLAYLGIKE